MRRLACLAALAWALAAGLGAQSGGAASSALPAGQASSTLPGIGFEPEPYKLSEFPAWTYDLRRGEIIMFGGFPIAYLLTTVCYDLGRYVGLAASGDSSASRYVPFSAAKPAYTNGELTGLIVSAAGVCLAVAVIDFIAGKANADEQDRLERRRQAEAALAAPPRPPAAEPSESGAAPAGGGQGEAEPAAPDAGGQAEPDGGGRGAAGEP